MSIEILPNELLQLIFSHCSGRDRKRVSQVCHRWSAAVQSQKTCLAVSIRPRPHKRNSRTLFMGKRILLKSNRQYAALKVEWRHKESDRNLQTLSDLLDICEERCVALQRLFLRVPPSETLVRFFTNRQAWLKDLVELHVKLEPIASGPSVGTGVTEVSFPHLREVSWYEYEADDGCPDEWFEEMWSFTDADSCHAIALNAPELRRLTVELIYSLRRSNLESRLRDVDACCLFLPTLELKPCRNLEAVTIKGLYTLSQRCVDNSERFLQNLGELSFLYCHGDVIQRICEKCPNLKELTIEEPPDCAMSLQISPVLSSCLEHLTISSSDSYFRLNGKGVFPKLQSISLKDVILEENVTLVAPQLTTCDILCTESPNLIIPHVQQIRTRKVWLSNETMEVPLPNVTQLHVHLARDYENDDEDEPNRLLQNHLEHSINVKRLTVDGVHSTLELSFIDHLQHLEWFSADSIIVRLTDVGKLAGLKTLILKNCTIKVEPTNIIGKEVVSLTALEYVRMYDVAIDGDACGGADRFPIRVNDRQPPIEFVETSYTGQHRFSSKRFD